MATDIHLNIGSFHNDNRLHGIKSYFPKTLKGLRERNISVLFTQVIPNCYFLAHNDLGAVKGWARERL